MRSTIRPVTLSRIIELTDFLDKNSETTVEEFKEKFGISKRRAKAIVAESRRVNLVEEENMELTEKGGQFHSAVNRGDWEKTNSILRQNSPHYGSFLDTLEAAEGGLTEEEILEALKEESREELKYNSTGFSLLSDWAERLRVVQQNVFNKEYYLVTEKEVRSPANEIELLCEELQSEAGINMKQRYVSIPELRETFCEKHQVSRKYFDELLAKVYSNNIGKMELSGAPLNTQAKDSSIGIKRIRKVQDGEITTAKMSSDQILRGIELGDGKIYYYIAIFDELNEVKH